LIDRYFDSAGVRIRYVEQGEGEPVVLVHSYTSDLENGWVKTGVMGELARKFRVIALDIRGHGKSDKPHAQEAYGPAMAWDIVRLLDHLGIESAHIIGYSMGAHVVAQLLTLAPERFRTATLGGASGRRNWTAENDLQVEVEAKEMERGLLTSQILRLWPAGQPRPTAAQIEALSGKFLAGSDYHALAALRRSNKAQVITAEQLAVVQVPVLGIVGSADPYLAGFRELEKVMLQLKVVVLEDATHNSAPSTPEFVRAIQGFLQAHAAN
jgi:pimeloyl-ACP methyl ester carboxylesterase